MMEPTTECERCADLAQALGDRIRYREYAIPGGIPGCDDSVQAGGFVAVFAATATAIRDAHGAPELDLLDGELDMLATLFRAAIRGQAGSTT